MQFARPKQLGGKSVLNTHMLHYEAKQILVWLLLFLKEDGPWSPERIKGWLHFISFQENVAK